MTDFIPSSAPLDGDATDRSSIPAPTHEPHQWGAPLGSDTVRTGPSTGPANDLAQHGSVHYPRRSLAIMALVMSVMGFFCFGITGLLGVLMARSDIHWIENGATDRRYYALAQAAFIIGMIGLLLWAVLIGILGVLLFVSSAST